MTNPQILELNPSAHFFLGIRLLYLLSKMTDKLDDSLGQIQTPHIYIYIYSIIYIHIYNIIYIYMIFYVVLNFGYVPHTFHLSFSC